MAGAACRPTEADMIGAPQPAQRRASKWFWKPQVVQVDMDSDSAVSARVRIQDGARRIERAKLLHASGRGSLSGHCHSCAGEAAREADLSGHTGLRMGGSVRTGAWTRDLGSGVGALV